MTNTLHAHISSESADCDGRYSRSHVEFMSEDEKHDGFGDLAFKERVVGGTVSFHSTGELKVTPAGATWLEPTDEGYRHVEIVWCEDDCKSESTYRDHTAEAAGY